MRIGKSWITVCSLLMLMSMSVKASELSPVSLPELSADFEAVPFAFSSDNMGVALGGAGVIKHAGQVQASVFGLGLYSSNQSWVNYIGAYHYQLPKLDSWLFSVEYYQGHYTEANYFLPSYEVPNLNDAGLLTIGDEAFAKLHAKYVLPWGKGRHGAARSLFPSQQPISWDPRTSGVSSIQFTPFWQKRELQLAPEMISEVQGIEIELAWDNRNLGRNSSKVVKLALNGF